MLIRSDDKNPFFNVYEDVVSIGGIESDKYKAIMREGADEPLHIASNTYTLLPNEVLFNRMKEEIDAIGVGQYSVRYDMADGGARTWMRFKLDEFGEQIDTITKLTPEITLRNSYDESMGVLVSAASIDSFCTNGLVFAKKLDVVYRRHSKHCTLEDVFITLDLENLLENFRAQVEVICQWREEKITADQAKAWLESIDLRDRAVDRMLALFMSEAENRGHSKWALVSALTNWATHGDLKDTGNDTAAITYDRRQMAVFTYLPKLAKI